MISNIAIHHFGGAKNNPRLSTIGFLEKDIDEAHRKRWPDFRSQLGSYIGYNFIIWRDGSVKQYRKLGEETAAQQGHNRDTISICLAGNFTRGVDLPTDAQKTALKTLIISLIARKGEGYARTPDCDIRIALGSIYPHRLLNPGNTSCYGTGLDDHWARSMIIEHYYGILRSLGELLAKLKDQLRQKTKVASANERGCGGFIG